MRLLLNRKLVNFEQYIHTDQSSCLLLGSRGRPVLPAGIVPLCAPVLLSGASRDCARVTTYVGTWFTGEFDLSPGVLAAWRNLQWGIAAAFAVLALELLYHFGPNVKQRFRDSLTGGNSCGSSLDWFVIPAGDLLPTLRIS